MDTLQAAKTLQDAGFDQAQAEAMVSAIGQAVDNNVASKTDVAELRAEVVESRAETQAEFVKVGAEFDKVRGEIDKVRGEIDKSRAETSAMNDRLRAELYRALALQTIAIVGAMVALLKLL